MVDAVYDRVPDDLRYELRGGWSMPQKIAGMRPDDPDRMRVVPIRGTVYITVYDDYEGTCSICLPSGNYQRALRRRKKGHGVRERNYCSTVIG